MAPRNPLESPSRLQYFVDQAGACRIGESRIPVYEPAAAADKHLLQARATHAQNNRNTADPGNELRLERENVEEDPIIEGDLCITATLEDYSNEKPLVVSFAYNGLLNPHVKLVHRVTCRTPLKHVKGDLIRTIPNYDRLSSKNDHLLTPIIYRVTHEDSGGCVKICSAGLTHFESQSLRVTASPTKFSSLTLRDVREGLIDHVYGRKKHGPSPFTSHWISTTQSFAEAYSRALMYCERKRYTNVRI